MAFVGGVGVINIDMIYMGIDRVPAPGEELYARDFGMYLGGGPVATLINLRRLGVEARVLTYLGRDLFSEFARRELCAAGAEAVNLYGGDGMPVVLSSTMVVGGDRAFMSYGRKPDVTDSMLRTALTALRGAKAATMEPGLLSLYRALKAGGTWLVFDTGWEEDLSLQKHAGSLSLADYYLPNRDEALKITGAASVAEAAEALEATLPCPIVKLDSEGCLYRENGVNRVVPPVPGVKAVDTTGAGDAFKAGFMYGLFHDCPIERCIQFGNITGAACVKAPGCLTGWVTEAELLAARDRLYG